MTKDEALRAAHKARDMAIFTVLVNDEEISSFDAAAVGDAAFANALAASGYVVVPVEATEEMLRQICELDCSRDACASAGRCAGETRWQKYSDAWDYALAAAQKEQR